MLYLIMKLKELMKEYDADGVKIYFKSEENYCVKFIREEKVVKVFRKKESCRTKAWDLKKTKIGGN